MNYLLLMRSN